MRERKYSVAVVGASGMVGREIISILEQRNFPVSTLIPIASERSEGEIVSFNGLDYAVAAIEPKLFENIDIALFSAGGAVSKKYAPVATDRGAVVIDNTSQFRMDSDVPLVVPEVNPESIASFDKRRIIANPNCSTTQMVVVLHALRKESEIERVVVSTYQAVSGAGKKAVEEMSNQVRALFSQKDFMPDVFPHQIAFNCLPHIDEFMENGYTKEEMKMIMETKKIMECPDLNITATTVRVPVFCSHSESINIQFEKDVTPQKAKKILSDCPGVAVIDDKDNNGYPLATEATGCDEVFVGRIRRDESVKHGLNMWVVSDNLRKGSALNAVQIAELLTQKYIK